MSENPPIHIDPKDALAQAEEEIKKATPAAKTLVKGALDAAYPFDQGLGRIDALEAAMKVASQHQQNMEEKPVKNQKTNLPHK